MVDALTALVNLASAIHTSANRFIFALAVVLGIYGVMFALVKEARMARQVPGHNGMGKIIGVIILGGMLVGLSQIINAGAVQLGWSDVTFDEVSYVSTDTFGGCRCSQCLADATPDAGRGLCTGWHTAHQTITERRPYRSVSR